MGTLERIALVTDFGNASPYIGQMKLVLHALVPEVPVIDLISDLPAFRPDLASSLLPPLIRDLPSGILFLCIVDPGVGGTRQVLLLESDNHVFIGPDNGILARVARSERHTVLHRVDWRPKTLSASFHGRDLFAPIGAKRLRGEDLAAEAIPKDGMIGWDWPEDEEKILYVDPYGNLMTGIRASSLERQMGIEVGGQRLAFARTFCAVPPGQGFWYENAFGLVELAVNRGRADRRFGVGIGDPIRKIP